MYVCAMRLQIQVQKDSMLELFVVTGPFGTLIWVGVI